MTDERNEPQIDELDDWAETESEDWFERRPVMTEQAGQLLIRGQAEEALAVFLNTLLLGKQYEAKQLEHGWHVEIDLSEEIIVGIVETASKLDLSPAQIIERIPEGECQDAVEDDINLVFKAYSSISTAGYVDGVHFTRHTDRVAELKRNQKLDEAEFLLLRLIEAAEATTAETSKGPPPWYYEQLAIVRSKLGNLEGEVEVLERYVNASSGCIFGPTDKLLKRLDKKRLKLNRI